MRGVRLGVPVGLAAALVYVSMAGPTGPLLIRIQAQPYPPHRSVMPRDAGMRLRCLRLCLKPAI